MIIFNHIWRQHTLMKDIFCYVRGKCIYMYIHTQPLPAMQVSEVPKSHLPIDPFSWCTWMFVSKSKSFMKYVSRGLLCFSIGLGGGSFFPRHISLKLFNFFFGVKHFLWSLAFYTSCSIRNPETASWLICIIVPIAIKKHGSMGATAILIPPATWFFKENYSN